MVWAVLGLYFYRQLFFTDNDISYQYWIKQTVTLSLLVITFYLNSSVLVPRLLLKNHTALYFVIIIGMVATITFINRWVDDEFPRYQFPDAEFYNRSPVPSVKSLRHLQPPRIVTGYYFKLGDLFTVIISTLVIGISITITALQKWQKDNQERKELEKEKVTSELSFLKAQIHPHFFFNTLNNIYVLTTVDPKIAGEAIHQLSKMMRYLLYDTRMGENMLSQEIAFVKNYNSLMKLRLTDVVKVKINIPDELHDMPLAPMIFLPFVENAYKHGVSATQQSDIEVTICQKDKRLELIVNNSKRKDNSISLDSKGGIGLINTRRRLELLYPGRYKLEITDPDGSGNYNVHLTLDLS